MSRRARWFSTGSLSGTFHFVGCPNVSLYEVDVLGVFPNGVSAVWGRAAARVGGWCRPMGFSLQMGALTQVFGRKLALESARAF